MGFGYKGLVFVEIMVSMGKHGQGTHCTKMGADSLAENTPNAPEFICLSPKVLDSNDKRLHWMSVVRGKAQKAKATYYTKLCCKRNYVLLYLLVSLLKQYVRNESLFHVLSLL